MKTAVKGRAGNIGPDLELCMADIWNVGFNEQNKLCFRISFSGSMWWTYRL